MNDCYWSDSEGLYYYECDTGRVIGEIIPNSDGVYLAFYYDAWNNSNLGRYIDAVRARRAVECSRKLDAEKWERLRAAWNAPTLVEEEPVIEPMKSWWKIWE